MVRCHDLNAKVFCLELIFTGFLLRRFSGWNAHLYDLYTAKRIKKLTSGEIIEVAYTPEFPFHRVRDVSGAEGCA